MKGTCTAVFDIGKSHVKLSLADAAGTVVDEQRARNTPIKEGSYDHVDTDAIWTWLLDGLSRLSARHEIGKIAIATHGAACALVDRPTGELLRPVMDYEWNDYPGRPDYEARRPPFEETFSPSLPAGLNLGRQLDFLLPPLSLCERERMLILLYSNYWAFRLTGLTASDPTSLGCHTDLWDVGSGSFSSLAQALGIAAALPPLKRPTEPLGLILPDIAQRTGLPADCRVWPGVHDSNASYAPWLKLAPRDRPTVVSTGTWCVISDARSELSALSKTQDMLANVDASGSPLPTARFMGGREFEAICTACASEPSDPCTIEDIEDVIASGAMALPSFAAATGPFGRRERALVGSKANGKALATLYCALTIDHMLTLLRSNGDIVVEGPFAQNAEMMTVLAALRPRQTVRVQLRTGGVLGGCLALTDWENAEAPGTDRPVRVRDLPHLDSYAKAWRERIG